MENKKIIGGVSATVLMIVAAIYGVGLIDQENVYYGTDGQSVTCQPMQCESLSGVNPSGLHTRCYYYSEELNRSTYKTCSDGWLKYERSEIKTEQINELMFLCNEKQEIITKCPGVNTNKTLYKIN